MSDNSAQAKQADKRTSWISLGFESLVHEVVHDRDGSAKAPFDVLVVGSGYGGAVAASQLAGSTAGGRKITVCVLERGQEYLEGAFPDSVDELAGHVRFASGQFPKSRGNLDALFDLRLGEDINVLVANGLGGGSLINAGVMLSPRDKVLGDAFPRIAPQEWPDLFAQARRMLGATRPGSDEPNRYPDDDVKLPPKGRALRSFAPGGKFATVPITVALQDRESSAGVPLRKCIECGDCMTGCNHGAKDSLDVNLLVTAQRRGAAIYTGATVLRLRRDADIWSVEAVPTDATLRERHGPPTRIHARHLILAAGTLGSTEILLKSRSHRLEFSAQLGRNFSGNGDMIAAIYDHKEEANAIARESDPPAQRGVGPTITSSIDLREDTERPYLVQELGVPGPLRRMFEEVTSLGDLLASLNRFDASVHGNEADGALDPFAVDPRKVRHSSLIAMMGDDGADGTIELRDRGDPDCGDASVMVHWPQLRAEGSIFDREMDALEALAKRDKKAQVLANPVWRMLPKGLEFLFDSQRGPPLTVHPLGGCAMGIDSTAGVVDDLGCVYDGQTDKVHPGLVVLDGSVIPQALGVNPSLTITAVALRAVRALRTQWGYKRDEEVGQHLPPRPVREADRVPAVKPEPQFEIRERLSGPAWIPDAVAPLGRRSRYVEITLAYEPFHLSRLMSTLKRDIPVLARDSKLRVFESEERYRLLVRPDPSGEDLEEILDREALYVAPLEGRLVILGREPSWWPRRVLRGVVAWFLNRGLRDILQSLKKRRSLLAALIALPSTLRSGLARAASLFRVASRAGEARFFEYQLCARPEGGRAFAIEGRKRLTYGVFSNLWEQLERMKLTRFDERLVRGRLDVDMNYFAAQRVPLMHVVEQPNMPAALVDLTAFGAYVTRLMVSIHAWSFRRPDTRPHRRPERMPGAIRRNWLQRFVLGFKLAMYGGLGSRGPLLAGLDMVRASMPDPVTTDLLMGERNGEPVRMRLTRYPRPDPETPPVLMLHGYSASGTTFAHTAVFPALGEYLSYHGRDVWILDMRTSSGMQTAGEPWHFEDTAFADIPAAVAHVLRRTGHKKLDVVAHCMGAAMFSIAVLAEPRPNHPFYVERKRLPESIRCAVLSQVGPLMQFTPLNVFRAYVMRYVRYYFGLSRIEFRIPEEPDLASQLADRFLSALRYPWKERVKEAWWAPFDNSFVGTRHRMDALYGRCFSLWNLNHDVLRDIDDFFGPLNFDTVAQTLHFALSHRVTDASGRACYLTRESRDRRWKFDTLTLHGVDNGLMDVATRDRIDNYFNRDPRIGIPPDGQFVQQAEFEGAGHQDSLIGKTRVTAPIFWRIRQFLEAPHAPRKARWLWRWNPAVPWAGPVWRPKRVVHSFALSGNPALGVPDFILCVPVKRVGDHFKPTEIAGTCNQNGRSSVFLLAIDADGSDWHRIDLPNYFLNARQVEGVLILHCYDHAASGEQINVSVATVLDVADNAQWSTLGAVNRQVILNALHDKAVESNLPPKHPGGSDEIDAILQELNNPQTLEARVKEFLASTPSASLDDGFIKAPGEVEAAEGKAAARIFAGSCQYSQGILDEAVAWKSYEKLGVLLDEYAAKKELDVMNTLALFVGDQVYADATAGLFDPATSDARYREPYEDLFSNKHVKKVMRSIPSAMMLDDHELRDNWEPSAEGTTKDERDALVAGVAAYKAFQRRADPPPVRREDEERLWFVRNVGGIPAFVADTRTDRLPRRHGRSPDWQIMGPEQFGRLLGWLSLHHGRNPCIPKIVACPAMLLPRRLAAMRVQPGGNPGVAGGAGVLASDSWDGFPSTFGRLLALIADHAIGNVIFIGGDEHLFCDARIRVRAADSERWTEIRSIHASPLYAPYPFANARAADFPERDRFTFESGGRPYVCEVETDFHPEISDGFVELVFEKLAPERWNVHATFHGSADVKKERGVVTQARVDVRPFAVVEGCGH